MNKFFWITLLILLLIYYYVPKISSIISLIGVLIFTSQLAAVISRFIKNNYYSSKLFIKPTNRLVLVTGCDSGFGFASAKRLDSYGFYVLAGVLNTQSDGAKYLNNNASNRLRTIKLDVTKQDDIDDAVQLVAYLTNYETKFNKFNKKFQNKFYGDEDGKLELWALINNAGVAQFTPFEFGHFSQDILPMFEVNVFGMMKMAKGFLPFLRQSQGRLINVGSVSDSLTISGLTSYSCTKHAVRSLTDGLRQELHKFKIKSILIEPTLYKTPISNIDQLIEKFNSIYERTDPEILLDYGKDEYKKGFSDHLKKMIVLTRTNIDEVVNSIEDAVTNPAPMKQYWVASNLQKLTFWIIQQLSLDLTDKICTITPPKGFVDFVQRLNN